MSRKRMYAAQINYKREHLFGAWCYAILSDRFLISGPVILITIVGFRQLFLAFGMPTAADVSIIAGSLTGVLVAVAGLLKVYVGLRELDYKFRAASKDGGPPPPDSAEAEPAVATTPDPNPKKARAKRRKRSVPHKPVDLPHEEGPHDHPQ